MCNPVVIGAVGIGLSVLGMAGNMIGNYYQGRVGHKMAKYQEEMARTSARQTRETGRSATRQQRIATEKAVGAQRAALGGSGVDVNMGSALDTQVETVQMGEMDALMIRQNYERQAWARLADSKMYAAAARASKETAGWGIASSFLTGSSSVADKYYRYNNTDQPTMQQRTTAMYSDYYNRRRRTDWNYGR